MPRYEFLWEKCQKPFELTTTIAESGARRLRARWSWHARRVHGVDGKEKLRSGSPSPPPHGAPLTFVAG
jgi:hypothetical protein